MAEWIKKPNDKLADIEKVGLQDTDTVLVQFGDVTIAAAKVSEQAAQRSVEESQSALERAVDKLAKPGVTIRPKKNVPLFRVDEQDPAVMVRTLNGKTERGTLENGQFQPLDE